jgi:predicted TIM-barrel fold metal-dependent hydrolase
MIIDSHCHSWRLWPYPPPFLPDDESRGKVEQLLTVMDDAGVDQAVVICANMERNPDNSEYIAPEVAKHPTRLHQFPDVDCHWHDTYHTPGAGDRLRRVAERWPIKGFTHYIKGEEEDSAWLYSEDGLDFFRAASELKLIASISCGSLQQPAIRKVAERFPSLPILCSHMGGARANEGPDSPGLKEVLASAKVPNIYLKISGFVYGARVKWEYPYSDVQWVVRTLYEHYGAYRLCWGSDYPPSRRFMTYRQSLEAFRTHCAFVPHEDKAWILGDNLDRLLTERQAALP